MPAYNFQAVFAPYVESGIKHQTIRAKRKQRPKAGQISHCFSGMRTRRCRRLGSWPIGAVRDVRIFDEGVLLDGAALLAGDLDAFAKADGFPHWPGMLVWFSRTHGLPFHGDLIVW